MMRLNIKILLIFSTFSLFGLAQVSLINKFKTSLISVSKDSVFNQIDNRLLSLEKYKYSDSIVVETLKYKLLVADSLKNKMMKHYAYLELLKYPNYLSKKENFKYLLKEGNIQINIGGVDVTMDYHFKAVKVAEDIPNDTLLFQVYKRIGVNYIKSKDYSLSLKYLKKAKSIAFDLDDSLNIASCNMTIGNNYKNQGVYDSAMVYYNKSLLLSTQIKWMSGLAGNYNNIGNVYRKKKQLDKSLEYFFLAEKMNVKSGNKKWLSYNYNNIGNTYEDKGEFQLSLKYFKKSQKIKEALNDKYGQLASLRNISYSYGKLEDYKNAFQYLQDYYLLNDSLINQSKLNLTAEIEAKFENDKKEAQISQLRAEQNLQDVIILQQKEGLEYQQKINEKEKKIRYAFGFALLSLLLIVFIFWKNSKERKKYVKEITDAKKVLDVKNKEITDSINYAKRIQTAVLPSDRQVKNNLPNSFIYYLPKDIVAGDFYWTNKVDDVILFAVADCTGHGVPGALVSMICNNALNSVIKDYKLTDTGKILDKTSSIVKQQFDKSDQLVRDGMDIALCGINLELMTLNYSGANNPLWIVRDGELLESKATKQPIGNYESFENFVTNHIQLQKGDTIYLSTDGFADQFGGENDKKFMKKNFKDLLVTISKFPIEVQKQKLNEAFVEWKSNYEQVDDVCVMGVSL